MRKFLLMAFFLSCFLVNKIFAGQTSLSFETGNTGGTGFSEEDGVCVSWKIKKNADFWNVSTGIQYAAGSLDITVPSEVFKTFFKDSYFSPSIFGGVLYHACFLSADSFMQDEFFTSAIQLRCNPINTSLKLFGGIGFNNIFVYSIRGSDAVSDFYALFSVSCSTEINNIFVISTGLSSFSYYVYDSFMMPQFFVNAEWNLTSVLRLSASVNVRYTSVSAEENMQIDHIDTGVGISYAL